MRQGIRAHVDQGFYSVNCWLTPDAANSDLNETLADVKANEQPGSGGPRGGLRIYRGAGLEGAEAHDRLFGGDIRRANRDFRLLHSAIQEARVKGDLEETNIQYRQNRCVVFRSNLIHETDPSMRFQPGYKNRRINLTFMFGNSAK